MWLLFDSLIEVDAVVTIRCHCCSSVVSKKQEFCSSFQRTNWYKKEGGRIHSDWCDIDTALVGVIIQALHQPQPVPELQINLLQSHIFTFAFECNPYTANHLKDSSTSNTTFRALLDLIFMKNARPSKQIKIIEHVQPTMVASGYIPKLILMQFEERALSIRQEITIPTLEERFQFRVDPWGSS